MRRIAVFARPPVPGVAKTRLSPALSPTLAAALSRGMLEDTLAAAAACGADACALWWADAPDAAAAGEVPPGVEVRRQRGADLGERLAHAFGSLLAAPGDRAVIIGADCPALEADTLRDAFARLEDHDLVLGPAADGGYTLIGLTRPCPALFEGLAWSTERVLAQTLERARAAGLRVATLVTLADLDTPAALLGWLAEALEAPPERAPRTRAALVAMGLLPTRV